MSTCVSVLHTKYLKKAFTHYRVTLICFFPTDVLLFERHSSESFPRTSFSAVKNKHACHINTYTTECHCSLYLSIKHFE